MNSKRIFLVILVILMLVTVSGYYYLVVRNRNKTVHYHAGFIVYLNGVKQDFSSDKYMSIEPCKMEGKENHEDDQKEKAHLHDGVGDIVHVHREGAVWGDLFRNISFSLPESSSVVGFINGQRTDNILETLIKPYDSVVIYSGKADISHQDYISLDHIKEVEKKSESCGGDTQ